MGPVARQFAPGGTIGRNLTRGALVGAAGWWAMDQVLRFLYDHQHPGVRQRCWRIWTALTEWGGHGHAAEAIKSPRTARIAGRFRTRGRRSLEYG